jgi:hypothetical protein
MSAPTLKSPVSPAFDLQIAVRPLAKRSSSPRRNKAAAIAAIVALGYPVGRYLEQIAADDDYAGGLTRIYRRMRQAYYQNQGEFLALASLMTTRLEGLGSPVLSAMARQAEGFVPMWQSSAQAQDHLCELQGWR